MIEPEYSYRDHSKHDRSSAGRLVYARAYSTVLSEKTDDIHESRHVSDPRRKRTPAAWRRSLPALSWGLPDSVSAGRGGDGWPRKHALAETLLPSSGDETSKASCPFMAQQRRRRRLASSPESSSLSRQDRIHLLNRASPCDGAASKRTVSVQGSHGYPPFSESYQRGPTLVGKQSGGARSSGRLVMGRNKGLNKLRKKNNPERNGASGNGKSRDAAAAGAKGNHLPPVGSARGGLITRADHESC